MLGLAPADAERVLDALTDVNVLEAPAPGRYQLHDLLRLFAAELSAAELPAGDRRAAIGRLVRWYAAALQAAAEALAQGRRPLPPGPDTVADDVPAFGSTNEAFTWCHQEQDNLAWAIRSAAAV